MKKKIFSVSLFIILTCTASAQYRYSGQWASRVAAAPTLNKGFNIQAGIEKFFRDLPGSIFVNADYIRYKKFVEITDFYISLPTLSVLYIYSLDQSIRPPLFINIGGGILVGSEIFEKQPLPYGIIQHSGGKFIWGFVFSPEFEYLIKKRFSCYIRSEVRYHFKARFDKMIFCPGIGVKIYF